MPHSAPEAYADQATQDYHIIIEQQRKSAGIYARLATRAAVDLGSLLSSGQRPFDRDTYIFEGCRAIADYANEQSIGQLALIDKSARPLWAGIDEYWRSAYPDEPRPGINFLNPSLFRTMLRESTSPAELSAQLQAAGDVTLEQLKRSRSPLADDLAAPVLLVDACLHSGKSVYMTKRVLEAAGFQDLRIGVINTTLSPLSPAAPQVFGTDNTVATRCIRSNIAHGLVANGTDTVHSVRVPEADIHGAGDMRTYMRDAVAARMPDGA